MLEDACKEMGLSDEAAEQITTAYGKQAEEKINKVNSMVVSPEEKLERELKDCMHCRFFWGHNNRCANGTCCKPSKKKEQKLPTECVGCPYYQGNGYCFPCMRKLIGK